MEKIGVNYKDIEHWLYFSILGVATKKLCGKEEDCFLLINKLSKKNQKFIDEYSAFINDNKIIAQISNNQISLQQINQRFILLSKTQKKKIKNPIKALISLINRIHL